MTYRNGNPCSHIDPDLGQQQALVGHMRRCTTEMWLRQSAHGPFRAPPCLDGGLGCLP